MASRALVWPEGDRTFTGDFMVLRFIAPAFVLLASCATAPMAQTSHPATVLLPQSALADDAPVLSRQELAADLDALYEGLQEAHFDLYARRPRAQYEAYYTDLRAHLTEAMTPTEAAVVFQRFAAFGNIAHTRIDKNFETWGRYREAGGKALPIYPRIRDGRFFVAEAYTDSVAPGDEVLAIDGRPWAEWMQQVGRNVSADNDYLLGSQLEFFLPLVLLLETGEMDGHVLDVRSDDGPVRRVEVANLTSDELTSFASEATETFFSLDAGPLRDAKMLDDRIAYLRPGPFYSAETPENPWTTDGFFEFIDSSFETFLDANTDALIIDLRQNPGGNSSFSDRMIAWFADEPFRFNSSFSVKSSAQSQASNQARLDQNPASAEGVSGQLAAAYAEIPYGEQFDFSIPFARPRKGTKFEGQVFALIDRYSYSNAANVAAILQDYGFAVLLGEETSDLATTYGAMETFTLPNSGLTVGYPKALIIRPSGDTSDQGVTPDIAIEVPVFSTDDVMLNQAISIIRERI